jgi:hypothetical protein
MILGNAISLYAAKKYYDGVCSIKVSLAVVDNAVVEKPVLRQNLICVDFIDLTAGLINRRSK